MKAEIRLMAVALLMIVLIVASCHNLSIAQEKKPMKAFSTDGGTTWETHWTIDLRRVE